jgi:enoyl-CoA hydratase/carnithine racemase
MAGRFERQDTIALEPADDSLVHPDAILVQPQAARGQRPSAGDAKIRPQVCQVAEGIGAFRRAWQILAATEDKTEGMRAFVEKRPAVWKGK